MDNPLLDGFEEGIQKVAAGKWKKLFDWVGKTHSPASAAKIRENARGSVQWARTQRTVATEFGSPSKIKLTQAAKARRAEFPAKAEHSLARSSTQRVADYKRGRNPYSPKQVRRIGRTRGGKSHMETTNALLKSVLGDRK